MLVTQADIEAALLRPLTTTEATYISELIDQASSLLRGRIPNIDGRITAFSLGEPSGINPSVVTAVLAGVIARFLRNPDGATTVSQGVGPYTTTRNFAGSVTGASLSSVGQIEITDADVATVIPIPTFSPGRTIRAEAHHPGLHMRWPL